MNSTEERFANRCLPMLIANQHGWFILNRSRVTASWNGGNQPSDLVVEIDGHSEHPIVTSHFGHGIVTWTVPYLFRTHEGYNLLIRGPANMPKDGIAPLEGIVETDWCVATFTMNWKFTRPGVSVFQQGDAFCMIVPVRRGELAAFHPRIDPIERDEATQHGFHVWQASRDLFNRRLGNHVPGERWQKHYFRGTSPTGENAVAHETKLNLREFVAMSPRALGEDLGE